MGIQWDSRFQDLKPYFFQTRSKVLMISQACLLLSGAAAAMTIGWAFFWRATPQVIITNVKRFAWLTVSLFTLGIIPRFKKEYWNDPAYRREIGKAMVKDIKDKELPYKEIVKRYGKEIDTYDILTKKDLNSFLTNDLNNKYSDFIDKHGKEVLAILSDENREVLKSNFLSFAKSTFQYSYKTLMKHYQDVIIGLQITPEEIEEKIKEDAKNLTYDKFITRHGLGCITGKWPGGDKPIISDKSNEKNWLKLKFLSHINNSGEGLLKIQSTYKDDIRAFGAEEQIKQRVLALECDKVSKKSLTYGDFRKRNGVDSLKEVENYHDDLKGAFLTHIKKEGKGCLTIEDIYKEDISYLKLDETEVGNEVIASFLKKSKEIDFIKFEDSHGIYAIREYLKVYPGDTQIFKDAFLKIPYGKMSDKSFTRGVLGVTEEEIQAAVKTFFSKEGYAKGIRIHGVRSLKEIGWTKNEQKELQNGLKDLLEKETSAANVIQRHEEAKLLKIDCKPYLEGIWKDFSLAVIIGMNKKAFRASIELKIFQPSDWAEKAKKEIESMTIEAILDKIEELVEFKILSVEDLEGKVLKLVDRMKILDYPWKNDKYWSKVKKHKLQTKSVTASITQKFTDDLVSNDQDLLTILWKYNDQIKELKIDQTKLKHDILFRKITNGELDSISYHEFCERHGTNNVLEFINISEEGKKLLRPHFCKLPYAKMEGMDYSEHRTVLSITQENIRAAVEGDLASMTYGDWIDKHGKAIYSKMKWSIEGKQLIKQKLEDHLEIINNPFVFDKEVETFGISFKDILTKRWKNMPIETICTKDKTAFVECLSKNIFKEEDWSDKAREYVEGKNVKQIRIGFGGMSFGVLTVENMRKPVIDLLLSLSFKDYSWKNDADWQWVSENQWVAQDILDVIKKYAKTWDGLSTNHSNESKQLNQTSTEKKKNLIQEKEKEIEKIKQKYNIDSTKSTLDKLKKELKNGKEGIDNIEIEKKKYETLLKLIEKDNEKRRLEKTEVQGLFEANAAQNKINDLKEALKGLPQLEKDLGLDKNSSYQKLENREEVCKALLNKFTDLIQTLTENFSEIQKEVENLEKKNNEDTNACNEEIDKIEKKYKGISSIGEEAKNNREASFNLAIKRLDIKFHEDLEKLK